MKHFVTASALASLALLGVGLAPTANADEWNKKTVVTVGEAIQLPTVVLQPGQYVFKLLDSPSNRHIVQIFNADESHLQTTILAIPNYRLQPTGKTQLQFWETPPGQPKALRAWFYPGDNFGQEFAYPKQSAVTIAQYSHTPVPTTEATNENDMKTAEVNTVNEKQETAPVADNTPAPQQQVVAQDTPPPAPEPAPTPAPTEADRQATPDTLPKTASPYSLIALIGLLSLAGFSVVRAIRVS
jgi:hypothetical protein